MANTKIRGMTLEIGGDTSGLEKALKGVNKEIKSTDTQLKDVERLLKLDPTNVDLLAQKQKLLADKTTETKEKLDKLKETQAQFIEQGGDINSDGYMALEREIIATENELKKAEAEQEKFAENGNKMENALESVKGKAEQVAEATKKISAAAIGGVTAIVGVGLKAGATADDINTMSKQTGVATDTIQKFTYASDRIDVSLDTLTGSMTKLKKQMGSSPAKFTELGVAVTNADGSMRSAEDVFFDTIDALSKIDDETQRDIIAMDIFGKGADALAGVIDDGGKALKEYGKEAEDLGLILDQNTLDSMNEVNDEIDKTKAIIQSDFMKAGASILEALAPTLQKVAEFIQKIAQFLGSLSPQTIAFVTTLLAVVGAISGVAFAIAKVIGVVQTILPLVRSLGAILSANPLGIIITAIGLLVTTLLPLIIANWDAIKEALGTAATWIYDNVIEPIVTFVQGLVDKLSTFFKNIWEGIKSTWEKIKGFILPIIEWIYNNIIKPIGNFYIGLANTLIEGLNFVIRALNKVKIKLPDWGILGDLAGKEFGINIKEVAKLPQLAKGGNLVSGSAIVGEAGAELLTIQNGMAEVRPLTRGTSSDTGALNQVVQLLGAILEKDNNTYLDGKQISMSVNKYLGGAL